MGPAVSQEFGREAVRAETGVISQEGLAALARLLWAMPRNPDLLALSDAINSVAVTAVAVTPPSKPVAVTDCPACNRRKMKQREKMKRYREKQN